MKWFRMYHSVLGSKRVRRLPESAQLDYFLLLCCASKYREATGANTGETGLTVPDAVWETRRETLEGTFPMLVEQRLAHLDRHGLIVMDEWSDRQFLSDDVAARTKKSKAKKAEQSRANGRGNVPGSVPANVPRHVRDTDTDTDTDSEAQRSEASVVGARRKSTGASAPPPPTTEKVTPIGRRLPKEWKLPKTWGEWALEDRPGWTADEIRALAEQFRDHWHAKAGKDGRKTDWKATWRNWVRDPKSLAFVNARRRGTTPAAAAGLSEAGQETAASLQRWLEKNEREGPNGTEGP